ncbi:MAG: RHS repeat domain-containing protein, partial [Candidatus Acidiferrales bacterium]
MKSILILSTLAAFLCVLSVPAAAQVSNGCTGWVSCAEYSLWNLGCQPPLPPTAYGCVGVPYAFETVCLVPTPNCSPAAAAEETCLACASARSGSPISLASGNTYIKETDVSLPGLSGGLTLVRTWNSRWPSTQTAFQAGLFGPNWRSNFEERVFVGSDNYLKYARGDGNFWSFGYSGSAYNVAAPANAGVTVVPGNSYWTMIFKNGERRLFDNTSGNLLAIIDRNGNTTQLTYDAVGRLATVTDPASRHLYFSYLSQTSFLVTNVTSDFGVSVSYSYDSQGRLL